MTTTVEASLNLGAVFARVHDETRAMPYHTVPEAFATPVPSFVVPTGAAPPAVPAARYLTIIEAVRAVLSDTALAMTPVGVGADPYPRDIYRWHAPDAPDTLGGFEWWSPLLGWDRGEGVSLPYLEMVLIDWAIIPASDVAAWWERRGA